jgi:Lon-like ATP-dependent protease
MELRPFNTTEEIEVPDSVIDRVIGQERAVEIIRKAALQKRFVFLLGDPGTGKSMLGSAMAELLPTEKLEDILILPNPADKNLPLVKVVRAGEGEKIVEGFKKKKRNSEATLNLTFNILLVFLVFLVLYYAILEAQPSLLFMGIIAFVILLFGKQYIKVKGEVLVPKLLINNAGKTKAPFVDATGSHAGALLGDVRHDPFQSGGVETPTHELIEAGAIHRAHKGVLFIDEVATLGIESQQSLLTAIQEKRFAITGRSLGSSGAMVRTEAVPTDFHLVLAGNREDLERMHPALRSRIRGYGYEVYLRNEMEDTLENRNKLVQFVAQEVGKDGKIPHFDREAVIEIIKEARWRAGEGGKLTLKLRGLGGLVRAAGDVAKGDGSSLVEAEHVRRAKEISKTLEQQMREMHLETMESYHRSLVEGAVVGRVNSLVGTKDGHGAVAHILAEVTKAQEAGSGKVFVNGGIRGPALRAVNTLRALLKKRADRNLSDFDVYIQMHEESEDFGDIDELGILVAVVSSLENLPIDQSTAIAGDLSLRGEILPVKGIAAKIEAALNAGLEKVVVPLENYKDVEAYQEEVPLRFVPVETLSEVLREALAAPGRETLVEKLGIPSGEDQTPQSSGSQ